MMSAIAMRAKRVALRSRPRLPAMSRVRAFATLETTTPSSAPRALGGERYAKKGEGALPPPPAVRRRYWPTLNWLWKTHVAGVPFEAQKAMVADLGSPFASKA